MEEKRSSKKLIVLGVVAVILVVIAGIFIGNGIKNANNSGLSLGETAVGDGVEFTLKKFVLTDGFDSKTYELEKTSKGTFCPNAGNIIAFIEYDIANNGKEEFSHHLQLDVKVIYDGEYEYGGNLEYEEVRARTDNPLNLDLQPLESKSYKHIILDCSENIVGTGKPVAAQVSVCGETFTYDLGPQELYNFG